MSLKESPASEIKCLKCNRFNKFVDSLFKGSWGHRLFNLIILHSWCINLWGIYTWSRGSWFIWLSTLRALTFSTCIALLLTFLPLSLCLRWIGLLILSNNFGFISRWLLSLMLFLLFFIFLWLLQFIILTSHYINSSLNNNHERFQREHVKGVYFIELVHHKEDQSTTICSWSICLGSVIDFNRSCFSNLYFLRDFCW